ncbi:MAG: rhodanese-like domain-containing protein [Acinetobacter populi]|jgi:rhodanese-related sulfurtransferase|uniref:rhodanese-like domain-containing protein n=1 Tax=Acinetobacter populi TaxID=1582270 RepID=UPI002353C33A|nr:rhodanese-like domain-containing protein [Acinetobacter populi]MCH4247375.1 rhodanese-like domain-containing protein [Acinetobacter populi]
MNAKVETQFLNTTAYSQLNQQQAQEILEKAQNYAAENELDFTGSLTPQEAWQLFQSGHAVVVDVRTNEERKFVGYVPETTHIAWATGTSFNRNPRFLKELENKIGKDKTILLLCRSGNRSALAAAAAYQAGFEQVYNILEGFEGDLNEHQQRNQSNGWRIRQLPWVQD